MKKLYLLLAACFYVALSFGQMTFPFEENFDTFMADQKFVQQVSSTTAWTTWSNEPGGAEDPIVSDAYALSEPNAIKIGASNDLVLLTGDKTDGRYWFSFNMYIPNGKLGYYNMLQAFEGSNSKWAYQILFNAGTATVQGSTEDYFTFENDKWFELKTIVDLDVDWCEIYKDGELVYEFQWSLGTSATNTKQMSAVNFYGWDNDGAGTPESYIDNVLFKIIESPESPSNLEAVLENGNDISLSWDAPLTLTPDSYSVYKNGIKVAEGLTVLTYSDLNVYPQDFIYSVRAYYQELGLSAPASATISVAGGIARKTVLFEIGTGTWCTYCPGAARGIDQLVEEGKNVSVIEYHYGDDYQTDETMERITYYGIDGYPTAVIDGTNKIIGGSLTGTMYTNYLGVYENAIDIPAVIDMNATIEMTGPTTGTITLTAEETFKYFESGLKLRFAITESHIEDSWLNMDEVNFVCRNMLVGAAGLDVDFSTQTSQEFTVDFEVSTPNTEGNLNLVAFIQHEGTKMVAQAINTTIPVFTAAKTTVTFNVDMTNAEDFTAGTDLVYVAGSFNNWIEPGTTGSVLLTDDNGDMIYSAEVEVEQNLGEAQYKYFKNAGTAGAEWTTGANRTVTIAQVPVTVNDVWGIRTSLSDQNLSKVEICPNPFGSIISIINAESIEQVWLQNSIGQTIMSVINTNTMIEIPTNNLETGMYFISIQDKEGNTRTQKLIKQ